MVVQRLEHVEIPQLAAKYADLEKVLVEYKVGILQETLDQPSQNAIWSITS